MDDATNKAVAVKYDPAFPAPFIIEKGKDHLAEKIKEIASNADVQIVEDPELSDRLFNLEIGNFIPESLYGILARILAFIYEAEGRKVK
jgi:type III secretion system FlhB-like substrate exporter